MQRFIGMLACCSPVQGKGVAGKKELSRCLRFISFGKRNSLFFTYQASWPGLLRYACDELVMDRS